MATPAIFVLVAIIMLAGAVTLGIVVWHLNTSANSPVAVDWGDKICKHVKNCKHENEQAVDWGNSMCIALFDFGITPSPCAPFKPGIKPPSPVAVDWGDMLCNPSKNGSCGEVFEVAVDWGNKKAKP
jgi:hypothetical protein